MILDLSAQSHAGRKGATGGMRASQGTFFEFLIRRIIKLNKNSMASSGQEKICVFLGTSSKQLVLVGSF